MPRLEVFAQPYAQYAQTAETVLNDAVDDADNDPTNELQFLLFTSLTNDLALSNGNIANLSSLRLTSLYRPNQGAAAMNVVDANGNVAIGSTEANGRLRVRGGSGTTNILEVEDSLGSDVFLVREDGRVGVTTAVSDSRFVVRALASDAVVLGLQTSTGRSIFQVDNDGDIEVFNESGSAQIIDVDGANYNVGIGGAAFNNVQLLVREEATGGADSRIFLAELANGDNILEVNTDRSTIARGGLFSDGDFGVSHNGFTHFTIETGNAPFIFNRVNTFVDGDFSVANGTKNFVIDHPLDPENKELLHNAVEGPGHYTFYHGVVTLSEEGTATVTLPSYFSALNGPVRYQLTPIGAAMPNLHVSQEVEANTFQIAGGANGKKVSWQITGERNDPWAAANPYQPEREKTAENKSYYHYPQGYKQPINRSIKSHHELKLKSSADE